VSERIDSLGLLDATLALPEQVEAAVAASVDIAHLPAHDDVANVVVLGIGASGLAGDMLAAVAAPFMPVPLVVTKGYEPPSFVDPSTLVIAISFSGDTEETVQALMTAVEAGAQILDVGGAGEMADVAEVWDLPAVRIPDGIPVPRAAVGALMIPPLLALEQMNLFPGASVWIAQAVEQLKRRRDKLAEAGSAAAALARELAGTQPIVYGGGDLGGVAAERWKAQCNENAKIPAWAGRVPDICHDEVAGWGQHGDITRQIMSLVLLRHGDEHPQVARRFQEVVRWTDEVVAGVHSVEAEGEGTLAQLLDLVLYGDVVSLELAALAGVDPGPTPVISEIRTAIGT